MAESAIFLVGALVLLTLGVAWGTHAYFRGTRGAITERPRGARGRTGQEGPSASSGLSDESWADQRGKR